VPVLPPGACDGDSDGVPRGLRPARQPYAHRPALSTALVTVLRAVGGAGRAVQGRPRRGDTTLSDPVSRMRRVLTVVGTDYHPFHRLVTWVDMWCARRPEVDCLIQ